MTSITQTISSLTGGISQQPDQLKLPGTVREMTNFIPDITEGLVKRPGSQFVKTLTGATTTGAWFSYYRDQSEGAYIGQVQTNGSVNIWKASDGTAQPVTGNVSAYLADTATVPADLKFLTVADTTFVTNTTKVVAQTSDISVKPGPSIGRGNAGNHYQTFIELRQVSHGRAYSFDVASATAAEEYTSGYSDRGPASRVSLGAEIFSPFHQLNRVDDITDHAGKVLSIDRNTGGNNSYKGLSPQLPFQGSEIVACSGGSGSGMIVRLTNVGQVNLSKYAGSTIQGDEYVGLYNPSVELLYGGDGYRTTQTNGNASFVTAVLKGVTYKIFIEEVQPIKTKLDLGTFRPAPTSFDGNNVISADTILDIDKANSDLTPTIEKIGNGFMLSHEFPFNVTTSEPDLWRITTTEVNDVSELPRQCKNGMIVKVANSSDSQEDDFYLKFEGNEGLDGPGKWVETIAPSVGRGSIVNGVPSANYIAPVNVHTTFNQETLPIKIQRTVDQSNNIVFHASYITWITRKVGDDATNPFPSFLGEKISQTFFHRNRLGFLCEDNVILSQADDLFNFFNNTALVVSGNDPIDITSSSTQPTRFVDCIETNTGLVIFGETQQFMLHTDSDSLTPDTAKLSNISTYRYSPETTPVSLGTTIGFLDSAGSYSRFFEMFDIKREGEPQIVDVTKVVSKLLPNTIDIISISRENNMIIFSTKGDRTQYLYRYFNTGAERLQGAWFEWFFPFNIAYTFVLDDDFYIVSTTHDLLVINLQDKYNGALVQDPTDLFINNTFDYFGFSKVHQVHMDSMEFVTAGAYNSIDNTTTVSWPNRVNHQPNISAEVVDANTGEVFELKSFNGDDFVFYGNFAGNAVIIGISMLSLLELPDIYVRKTEGNKTTADITASLVIQRIHYHFSELSNVKLQYRTGGTIPSSGPYPGNDFFNQDVYPTFSNRYKSDGLLGDSDVTVTNQIYQRNTNFKSLLYSTHPGPCSLNSLTWEGDYTPKFHKRV